MAVAVQPDVHRVAGKVIGRNASRLHLTHDELVIEQTVLPHGHRRMTVGRLDQVGVLVAEGEYA